MAEYWDRIMAAVRRLDARTGREWRLTVLVEDGPEAATELTPVVSYLGSMELRHERTREANGARSLFLARVA